MSVKDFVNKITGSNRIYTREDIGKMSTKEYTKNEKAINYQLNKIGVPTNGDLSKSGDAIYIESYTRKDGTKVKSHYRSKSGRTSTISEGGDDYTQDSESKKQNFIQEILNILNPNPETTYGIVEGDNGMDIPSGEDNSDIKSELSELIEKVLNGEADIDDYMSALMPTKGDLPPDLFEQSDIDFSIPEWWERDGGPLTNDIIIDKEQAQMLFGPIKAVVDFGKDALGELTNMIPDDWDLKPVITETVGLAEGFLGQLSEELEYTIDKDAFVKKKLEERELMEKFKLQQREDTINKILNGKFKEVDWASVVRNSDLYQTISTMSSEIGGIASIAISGLPAMIDIAQGGFGGDKQLMIKGITNITLKALVPVSEMAASFSETFGKKMDELNPDEISQGIEFINEMKELEECGYRYEKLVSAEILNSAVKEANKFQELANKFTTKAKDIMTKIKSPKDTGIPTGGASEIIYTKTTPAEIYETPLPNVDFSKHMELNSPMQINGILNQNRPDAREFFDISLAGTNNLPSSDAFKLIPNDFNSMISQHMSIDIPRGWNGLEFEANSSIAKELSYSNQLQTQVNDYFKNPSQYPNKQIPITLNKDTNLHYSIGHSTILNPSIDKHGNFTGVLYDKYDFDKMPWISDDNSLKTAIYNNYAYWRQQNGKLENYYVLIPIKFKIKK